MLTKSETAKVLKNLKKYEKQFDAADKERKRAEYLEKTTEKRALRSRFRERMARLREFKLEQKAARVELYDGYDSDDDNNYTIKEHHVETVLSTKEEVVY